MRVEVNVQIESAIYSQDAMHLHQSYAKPAEKSTQIVAVGFSRCIYHTPNSGLVILNLAYPLLLDIIYPLPTVFETCALRQAVWLGVEVLSFLERRIRSDEMHRLAVYPAQKVEVVAVIECAILEIGLAPSVGGTQGEASMQAIE